MPAIGAKDSAEQRELFWVDNTVSNFQSLQGAFKDILGWSIRTADSIQKALGMLRNTRGDIVLIDYSMGTANGLTMLPDIAAAGLASHVYICSGYAYSERIFGEIKKSAGDLEVGFIPKERLPGADEPDEVIEFGKALIDGDFLPHPPSTKVKLKTPRGSSENNAAFPSWDEYAKLDLRGRVALLQQADTRTEGPKAECFRSGDFAVLFCGNWNTPVRRYKSAAEVPDESDIIRLAHDRGFAPFLFCFGGNLDDLSARCSPSTRLQDYYAVELSYRQKREAIHLDTGNPFSLFGYEWYLENGWIDPIITPQLYEAGEMKLWGKNIKFRQAICLDNRGQAVPADIAGFAVTEWTKYRVCVDCPNECRNGRIYPVFPKRVCLYRTGLLGRSFLREVERLVTFDAERSEIAFVKRGVQ
jgi:CheY-like chemotaxis protein